MKTSATAGPGRGPRTVSRLSRGGLPVRGFSLIELIGVLAIIAIMAAVIAPNAVRMLDRAAVRAEQENLETFGDLVKHYETHKTTAVALTSTNWHTHLANYADLNVQDVQVNKRHRARIFSVHPSDPTRVILLSSMHSGLTVPAPANATQFDRIWNHSEITDPPLAQHMGWAGWQDYSDYVAVQRVNLSTIAADQQRTVPIRLNNVSAVTTTTTTTTTNGNNGNNGNGGGNGNGNNGNGNGNNGNGNGGGGSTTTTTTTTTTITAGTRGSYRHYDANNVEKGYQIIYWNAADGPTGRTVDCRPNESLALYANETGTGTPNYVYVVGDSGKTLQLVASGIWLPQ